MASYQVPQFLDSGDKILLGLNLRQFGYALGGFVISIATFSIVGSIAPQLGIYAIIPAVPVALIAAYMAWGKFNGRDADVYVVKWVLYLIKAKRMIYSRAPYVEDLDKRQAEWSAQAINKRWIEQTAKNKKDSEDEFSDFRKISEAEKAEKIKRLGRSIDSNIYNTLSRIEQQRLSISAKEAYIRQLQAGSRHTQTLNKRNPLKEGDIQPLQKTRLEDAQAQNFFADPSNTENNN